jgi:hypothetical protein
VDAGEIKGPQGFQGFQGVQGVQGAQGVQGPQGDAAGVYEPVISKATGYLTWNGSSWVWKNETYSLSSHDHSGTYQPLDEDLTAIAALGFTSSALLRKTAANTWTLDTATYLTAITKAMVEAVLTGTITSHNHSGVYQPVDADLTAIAALAGTTGLLRKTAADTWTLDPATYLTANQSITLSGDASGSGTTSISVTITGLRGAALPTLAAGFLRYGEILIILTPASVSCFSPRWML